MRGITLEDAKLCVGKGWHKLIEEIYNKLTDEAYVVQVKEKYGGLRFYVDGVNRETLDFIEKQERKSVTICEVCGAKGQLLDRNTWLVTRCKEHERA